MTKLSKIAILISDDSNLTFELEDVRLSFLKAGIETRLFYDNESILLYQPDCVIITSPQEGRLTPYPTYGLINKPRGEYLETPRFIRNILTYDGYFTFSPTLKQMLGDLMFGARKLGTSVMKLDFFPTVTEFRNREFNAKSPKLIIFDSDCSVTPFREAIFNLLNNFQNASVVSFSVPEMDQYSDRFILAKSSNDLLKVAQDHDVAICLKSGDEQNEILSSAVLKLVSAGVATIAHRTEMLESYFGDNLWYIPEETSLSSLPKLVEQCLNQMIENTDDVLKKSRQAHKTFMENLSFDSFIPKFIEFHAKTLIDKGYQPDPDPSVEKGLPSVSFIVRTGGKHRHFLERTLDCMVAQQYPDLRVIFVVHQRFSYIEEIIAKYPSLKIKVIESIKSRRAKAICDGMAAVETDLFGLYDDDDEMFPNHVRMLVKTLQYHANRDWRGEISMVYSGSIKADDTYPVHEMAEFQDHRLSPKKEKRAIEWFRFYSSDMMSQHTWFMPNGWLARSKFIDNELLMDPELDTCEDLYFELQFAQRGHFAFSAEVTTIHHFHHFGNSTIVDSHKHQPDTQRIALRNFSRVFPQDSQYDIAQPFRLVGELSTSDSNQIGYQDYVVHQRMSYFHNPFYPLRNKYVMGVKDEKGLLAVNINLFNIPVKALGCLIKFMKLDIIRRRHYINRFNAHVKEKGWICTFKKIFLMFLRKRGDAKFASPSSRPLFNSYGMKKNHVSWLKQIKLSVRKMLNKINSVFYRRT